MGDLIVANEKPFVGFAPTEFKNRRNVWFLIETNQGSVRLPGQKKLLLNQRGNFLCWVTAS
jgi:hypothetical protein